MSLVCVHDNKEMSYISHTIFGLYFSQNSHMSFFVSFSWGILGETSLLILKYEISENHH